MKTTYAALKHIAHAKLTRDLLTSIERCSQVKLEFRAMTESSRLRDKIVILSSTGQHLSMIIPRLFAACVGAPVVAAALVVLTASAPGCDAAAAEAEVRAADRAAVASCLDLVAQAAKRQGG